MPICVWKSIVLPGKVLTRDLLVSMTAFAGAAWSWFDPWLFASLSYDGRLVVNRVPNQTKYKVLL